MNAKLNGPNGVWMGTDGNTYIAVTNNNKIRKVDIVGIITSFAGDGTAVASSPSGGKATSTPLYTPTGIWGDSVGFLFLTEAALSTSAANFINYGRVRKISTTTNIVENYAGTGNGTFSGDLGPATAACVNNPALLAGDTNGNLFIADYGNNRVRKVDGSGIITTFAGEAPSLFLTYFGKF